jgi:glycosyltransferase involved in cell wall biosynthesis
MLINFVSNLPRDLRTGGFSAMNVGAFEAIRKSIPVVYIGPVNPPVIPQEKITSKMWRLFGLPGNYFFFSPNRLAAIAEQVQKHCHASAKLDFFHGFTPWIMTRPSRPYMAWSDCTFYDYIRIFHRRDDFVKADVARIEQQEAEWLKGAARVLFSSNWAAECAMTRYGLKTVNVASVGIFGELEEPDNDVYSGSQEFAFISTNFRAKGGEVILAAFREVRKQWPTATLNIIGERPTCSGTEPGVSYFGFLRKEVPEEYRKFKEIMARARAVVNATKSDAASLLIVEAGYFGCPIISSHLFAASELVDNGRSGILLDDPTDAGAIANAMMWMLSHDARYLEMRRAAWVKAHGYSRRRFQERLIAEIYQVLGEAAASE